MLIKLSLVGPLYLSHRYYFPKNIGFLSLKTRFVLANSVDPDEMPLNQFIKKKFPQQNLECKIVITVFFKHNLVFKKTAPRR